MAEKKSFRVDTIVLLVAIVSLLCIALACGPAQPALTPAGTSEPTLASTPAAAPANTDDTASTPTPTPTDAEQPTPTPVRAEEPTPTPAPMPTTGSDEPHADGYLFVRVPEGGS